MIQKLPRLYKVERYGFDFVLVENSNEAKSTDLDIKLETTVTEITEMSPKDEGYSWKPRDAWGDRAKEGCGEWLERTAEQRRQEENKEQLLESALNKLSEEERNVLSEILSYHLNTR
jgi:DNA-directed RNA polymerase specialized sigma subunit